MGTACVRFGLSFSIRTEQIVAEVFRLRVSLRGAEPEIWRQVEVVFTITLFQLHGVL